MFAKTLVPLTVLVIAIGIAFVLVQNRPQAKQQPKPPPVLFVETLTATKAPVTFIVSAQGEVSPRTETTLVSEVSGQIISVADAFVSGGFFKRGDLLVRIDPRIYETQLKSARANVAQAKTQVATENALAGYALEDWKRLQNSVATANKPASDLALRKPQLAAALATLESAQAEFEQAMGDLERTFIQAPYDGMVRKKLADVGQFVNRGDELANTFATDYAEVRLPLTQQDMRFIDLPSQTNTKPVPVILSADMGGVTYEWQAEITRTEGVFDARTRVLYAVAQVQDPYGTVNQHPEPLRIGTFVSAQIQGRDAGLLFSVPRHAMYRGDQLWLVNDANELQPADVSVVRSDTHLVYIDDGLTDGDRICITPIETPIPGMPVRT